MRYSKERLERNKKRAEKRFKEKEEVSQKRKIRKRAIGRDKIYIAYEREISIIRRMHEKIASRIIKELWREANRVSKQGGKRVLTSTILYEIEINCPIFAPWGLTSHSGIVGRTFEEGIEKLLGHLKNVFFGMHPNFTPSLPYPDIEKKNWIKYHPVYLGRGAYATKAPRLFLFAKKISHVFFNFLGLVSVPIWFFWQTGLNTPINNFLLGLSEGSYLWGIFHVAFMFFIYIPLFLLSPLFFTIWVYSFLVKRIFKGIYESQMYAEEPSVFDKLKAEISNELLPILERKCDNMDFSKDARIELSLLDGNNPSRQVIWVDITLDI